MGIGLPLAKSTSAARRSPAPLSITMQVAPIEASAAVMYSLFIHGTQPTAAGICQRRCEFRRGRPANSAIPLTRSSTTAPKATVPVDHALAAVHLLKTSWLERGSYCGSRKGSDDISPILRGYPKLAANDRLGEQSLMRAPLRRRDVRAVPPFQPAAGLALHGMPDARCLPDAWPAACSIAWTALSTLAVSIPVNASRRSTGMPSARLAASRSTLRSPPLQGRPPLSRAVIADGQSITAIVVMPSVMLVPMST